MDPGMTKRLSLPRMKRAMCGATRPMKPMIPVYEMMEATRSDMSRMHSILNCDTFRPRLLAVLSPWAMRFRLR